MNRRNVTFEVNGSAVTVDVEARTLLSDVLRHELGLTGTHVGCEQGSCGACTVIVDGRAVRSCLMLAPQADGTAIETIESVADGDDMDPVQQAMHTEHGLQCGFCTPGIVMSLVAARRDGLDADTACADVLGGHLCRCTGYVNIRRAVRRAWNDLPSPSTGLARSAEGGEMLPAEGGEMLPAEGGDGLTTPSTGLGRSAEGGEMLPAEGGDGLTTPSTGVGRSAEGGETQ